MPESTRPVPTKTFKVRTPYMISVNDRLVIEWRYDATTKTRVAKRPSPDCPLSREETQVYVRYGAVEAAKAIRDGRRCSLSEALTLLNQARYGTDRIRRID
jgi:hypothetical protein